MTNRYLSYRHTCVYLYLYVYMVFFIISFYIFIFKNYLHTYFSLFIIYIMSHRISKIKNWEYLLPVFFLRRRNVLPVRWCHFLCKDHSPCHQVLSDLVSIPLPAVTSPLLDISGFRGITTLLGTNPRTLCCST